MKNREKLLTNPIFITVIAVFCTMLWGSAFPCIKTGYKLFRIDSNDISSTIVFAGARFAAAGLIVLIIGLIISPKKMPLRKNDILPISLLGLFQTFLQYLLLYIGLVNVSGTKSSVLTSVAAFASVILSALFFKNDSLTIKKLLGCVIGITGIVVMNIGGDMGGFLLIGDGLVILSNLSGAAGNIITKKISGGRSPIQISAWQFILGGSALIIVGLLFGGKLVFYEYGCVLILLYLAAMAGTAFLLWTMLISHNSVSRIAVFNLLIPVFGTMWSGLFLGENILTASNIFSLILVCSGIFLVNFKSIRKGSAESVGTDKQNDNGYD